MNDGYILAYRANWPDVCDGLDCQQWSVCFACLFRVYIWHLEKGIYRVGLASGIRMDERDVRSSGFRETFIALVINIATMSTW